LFAASLVGIAAPAATRAAEPVNPYPREFLAAEKAAEWTFGGDVVATIQAARRLHEDLGLDPQALALALTLIGRIHDLEAELRRLRAELPRRSA